MSCSIQAAGVGSTGGLFYFKKLCKALDIYV
nr:MAG TPA: hypothetical protein [Caudoviricetes sp.]